MAAASGAASGVAAASGAAGASDSAPLSFISAVTFRMSGLAFTAASTNLPKATYSASGIGSPFSSLSLIVLRKVLYSANRGFSASVSAAATGAAPSAAGASAGGASGAAASAAGAAGAAGAAATSALPTLGLDLVT